MATIVCKQCLKTFKTETGFAWHHAHQHDLNMILLKRTIASIRFPV